MKKFLILALAFAVVMMFSVGVMAEPHPDTGDDPETPPVEGAGWVWNVGTFAGSEAASLVAITQKSKGTSDVVGVGVTVNGATVTGSQYVPPYDIGDEDNPYNQSLDYKIKTVALIPCYLEMNIFGNGGWGKAKSIGQGASATIDRTSDQHWMIFNTDLGGIMNDNWSYKTADQIEGLGNNYSEVGPKGNTFIAACDMWTANLYANVNYGFGVDADPFAEDTDNEFYIQMRHYIQEGGPFSSTLTLDQELQVGTFDAMEDAQVNMQFRVPFGNVPAGQYNGTITFKMYSL